MMDWRQFVWALIALVVLRITILPNFWVALGLVALVWLWNWLHTQFPEMRKLINWGLALLLAFAFIGTVGLNLYKSYVEPNTPMTRAAGNRAIVASDMETAMKVNPHMLKSRLEAVSHIQWIEDRVGDKHAKQLAEIRRSFEDGVISQDEALVKSRLIAEEARNFGDKTRENLSLLTTKPTSSSPVGSWPWRLVFFGAIMLTILLIPEKFMKIPGKKLIGFVGVILLFAGLTFVIFPEIQPSNLALNQPTKTAKAPTVHKSSPAKEEITAFVPKPLIPTGVTLAPGESLRVTKDSSTPAIPIILRLSDGEERDFPASFWGTRHMNYSHTGTIVNGRSATIFYQGEAGKYHFEKNPAKPVAVPEIYHPPSATGKQPAQKEDCPFN